MKFEICFDILLKKINNIATKTQIAPTKIQNYNNTYK